MSKIDDSCCEHECHQVVIPLAIDRDDAPSMVLRKAADCLSTHNRARAQELAEWIYRNTPSEFFRFVRMYLQEVDGRRVDGSRVKT